MNLGPPRRTIRASGCLPVTVLHQVIGSERPRRKRPLRRPDRGFPRIILAAVHCHCESPPQSFEGFQIPQAIPERRIGAGTIFAVMRFSRQSLMHLAQTRPNDRRLRSCLLDGHIRTNRRGITRASQRSHWNSAVVCSVAGYFVLKVPENLDSGGSIYDRLTHFNNKSSLRANFYLPRGGLNRGRRQKSAFFDLMHYLF